jgi:hypothetical protein
LLERKAPTLAQSSDAAQALEKILSPATIECTYGISGLLILAVCHMLAIPHCTTDKAFELERIEY